MMTKDEALKMAIREMTDAIPHLDIHFDDYFEAIQACKEALEQPAQEPAYQVGEIVNPYGSNIKIKQTGKES